MNKLILMLTAFALAGCASMGRKLDADRAAKMKKVAILSFEVHQQQPTDNLGIAKFKELKNGRPGDSAELKKMADETLDFTAKELARTTGWKVVSPAEVRANGAYAAKYQKAMAGLRHATMTDGRSEAVLATGILDQVNFRKMDQAERAALAKALAVDGFAEVMIYQTIEQSRFSLGHLSGDADFALKARSNLTVYALDSDDPVWRIQNIDGDETAKAGTLPKEMPKLAKLATLGEQASRSALGKMLETYKTQ